MEVARSVTVDPVSIKAANFTPRTMIVVYYDDSGEVNISYRLCLYRTTAVAYLGAEYRSRIDYSSL